MEKVIGIGVMLQTPAGSFLLQERDSKAQMRPDMIAPFGGGIEGEETASQCAIREIKEELNLTIKESDLESIKLIESINVPGSYIHMFLLKDVDKDQLVLGEGRAIAEMDKDSALANSKVTDFTKQVLNLLE